MNQYMICRMRGAIFSFLLENGKAAEIHCDREKEESLLGNIYVGRVKDVAKNIGAAFIEISPGKVCYLSFDDLLHPIYTQKGSSANIQQGDELFVQVSREAIKSKYPSVTTNLTFYGKYMLLTTGKTQICASSKLEKREKQRLIQEIREISEAHGWGTQREGTPVCAEGQPDRDAGTEPDSSAPAFGWLIRTNAAGAERAVLETDMARLFAQYQKMTVQSIHRTRYSCVLGRPHAWIARLSDLYDAPAAQAMEKGPAAGYITVDQYLTDDREIYEDARAYLTECQPDDLSKLVFYEDAMQPMMKRYSLERELTQALSDMIWLDSGGYLIIQPTEAMTVIDVNTGKYEGGKDRKAAILKVNREAAAEAARQIRLRNLSGIIVIDFINMESPEDNEALMDLLENLIRRDPVHTVLVDMTKLSLVEITRQKKEKPLHEVIKND